MFGPKGTGKSLLAKAIASETTNITHFYMPSSNVLSKSEEKSEQLIRDLFKNARNNKPSIIFIDCIESFCSSYRDNDSETLHRIKTEFLYQMQCKFMF